MPQKLLLALSLLAQPAAAHEFTLGALTIGHPYAAETPPGAMTGAGYLTIANAGPEADRLIAVRADFPNVSLHRTEAGADGVVRMRETEGVAVPAGGEVALAPGGDHVMFMGLAGDPFEVGERIPAVLVFENAGEVAVEFVVEPRTAAGDHAGH